MHVQVFLLRNFQFASLRIIGVIFETDDSRYPTLVISYLFKNLEECCPRYEECLRPEMHVGTSALDQQK